MRQTLSVVFTRFAIALQLGVGPLLMAEDAPALINFRSISVQDHWIPREAAQSQRLLMTRAFEAIFDLIGITLTVEDIQTGHVTLQMRHRSNVNLSNL